MGFFFIIIYVQGALISHKTHIYCCWQQLWGGVAFVPWQFCWWKWFFKQNFKNYFGPIIIFPLSSHYPSLLNDIQVWDINILTTNENGFYFFNLFIFQSWMKFIQWFIYLIQLINEIHPCKNDIHLWTHLSM
jgi:hypothetical protein